MKHLEIDGKLKADVLMKSWVDGEHKDICPGHGKTRIEINIMSSLIQKLYLSRIGQLRNSKPA